MKHLNTYFSEETIEFTKNYNFENNDYYAVILKKALEKNDIEAMFIIGSRFTRNNHDKKEVKYGIGWLLKLIDTYDSGNYKHEVEEDRLISTEYLYYRAKYCLATIFLPNIPCINSILKMHVAGADGVYEDHDFGLQLLKDCAVVQYGGEPFIELSLMYFSGCVVEKDIKKAKEYYEKAIDIGCGDDDEEFLKSYGDELKKVCEVF